MSELFPLPEHDHIADAVDVYSPSELHGHLCGLLCTDPSLTGTRWLEILDADSVGIRDEQLLMGLHQFTVAQLRDDDMTVSLMLPDDEMNLCVRADALGLWCQGYLAGLGSGGLPSLDQLTGGVSEFLDDVSQIARVGLDGDRAEESDELAYTEIVEYLRMGLLLVAEELQSSGSADSERSTQRLH